MDIRQTSQFGRILRLFAIFLIVLMLLFIVVPLIFTVLGSFSVYWSKTLYSKGVTLKWYQYIWQYYRHTILRTFAITSATVLINVLLGSMAAYKMTMTANRNSLWIKLAEELYTLPMAIPGIAIGLSLAQAYPHLKQIGVMILVGHVLYTFPIMLRTVTGALRTKNYAAIDECAASLGAGPFYRFFKVIFPAIRVPVISGAINVFMLSLGEFNITFFLYNPFVMTLPVGMYEAYASLRIEAGSAFTAVFLLFAIPLTILMNRFGKSQQV